MLVCDTTKKRLIAFSGFFFALGIPDGFIYTTLAAALAEKGIKLEIIGGILAMGTFPWTFKVFLGLIIDRFRLSVSGSRHPWIIIGQIGVAISCVSWLGFKDIDHLLPFLPWLVLIQNIFSALLDAAVDGMAVDLLPEAEKGRANGFMRASNIVGVLLGGVLLTWIMTKCSWRTAIASQSILMLAACGFALFVVDPPANYGQQSPRISVSWVPLLRTIWYSFMKRGPIVAICIGISAAFAGAMFETGSNVFFIQKLGWTKEGFVSLSGGWAYLIAIGTSLMAGVVADRYDRRRVAYVAAMCTALVVIAFPICKIYWSIYVFMGFLIILQSITTSILGVSLFALYMDLSAKEIGATQFCGFMAFLNIGGMLGEKAIGPGVAHFDWTVAFITVALLYGLTGVGLVFVRFPHNREAKQAIS